MRLQRLKKIILCFLPLIFLVGIYFWRAGSQVFLLETFIPSTFDKTYKQQDPASITLVAFGDMMLDRYVWTLMERYGHDYPFQYFPELLASMLITDSETSESDLSTSKTNSNSLSLNPPDFLLANLEGPISDSTYVNPGTAMIFNFKPAVVETLKKYGFNLLNLANNHAYDMGPEKANQTREYLAQAGINFFGDAQRINENTAWQTEIKGMKFTFLGFNDTTIDHLDYQTATNLIKSFDETSDFLIVSIHWGTEYRTNPTQTQIDHAHAFVEAGADVILGHHPHVIEYIDHSPVEWFLGPDGLRPIYYSLGNFIFDQYFQANVQEGLGVVLKFQKIANSDVPDLITTAETVFDLKKSQVKARD
ncbi:MAG: capsule biosynthesis protein, poly-gamma-glutamate synthesis protein (capsule biosynthesis protein) [Candidatus Peregrinibacteria bacterium GW2011_GWE2_39_6]|nr:MAG: capsule biosynthesis protein, poly-gamma-glutamate synthesis protein (capsule biosynthesis protein) [Candidatus Peregrinibacteria bacterium GW2011_GWF2_39_17]KKR26148.1 MAG: capsule biosynthesis protein, poly-gamma-glutamate synthesis protein (capsule biosynthesis protein) [Candidatus Peregrinibacteria bacterium GW2011_GWE2_39_6]HCW32338.1 hypothetical protein [Candidatus Peregrinibacteria bacterium]